MIKRLAIAGALVVIAGCATVSQMTATSGSRADGIVKLSFEYGMFDKIQLDQAGALRTAEQRCGTWGYSGAEPFGGMTRQCQAYSGYGCMRWFATVEYQCTSGPANAQAVSAMSPAAPTTPTLSQGVNKIRAKTASGYCLDVPSDYVGTGSSSRPAVTKGMPRCSNLSAD